jgi:hypothetical protein
LADLSGKNTATLFAQGDFGRRRNTPQFIARKLPFTELSLLYPDNPDNPDKGNQYKGFIVSGLEDIT